MWPRRVLTIAWIMLNTACINVESYSVGAPSGTCFTRYPKHKTAAQTSTPPYDIQVSPNQYKPGDIITVTVVSKDGATFKGLQMAAFRATGNDEEILGQFIEFPEDKIKSFTCVGSYKNNMITHKNEKPAWNVTVKWRAPETNVGDILFKTSLVQVYELFWVDLKTDLLALNHSNIVESSYKAIKATQLISEINFSECGETKGCLLYPATCSGTDCVAAVTFHYDTDSGNYQFELMSSNQQDYVSLGFSDDNLMGKDEVVLCISKNGNLNIQHGWNPSYHYERKLTRFLSQAEIRASDGRLQCRFMLPRFSSVVTVNQEADVLEYFNQTFDHSERWYLQIAWGKVIPASDVISKHEESPAVSYQKIDLKKNEIFTGSSYGYLVQAHAALMIVAWIFLTGIVTVISRHYRDWMPRTRWFGTKVWFQIHRALAIGVVSLTVIAFTCVFSQFGLEIRKSSVPHSYVGLTVLTLVILQLIFGMLRPGPDDKVRVYFNWGHQILGQIIHLLAAVTMFLGFNMKQTVYNVKSFGTTVLCVWLVGQLAWHIIFEIIKCKGKRQESSSINGEVEKDKKDKTSKSLTLVLLLYALFLLIVTIAAMSAVFIY
ncbi:putative ferric-chelate reductase 1 homolog isoform X1 [Biomphalaria glabrata]|uniref:Ferric-chelate reductase 1 homolog isoform X1 n=1 Tax=Biomphalaria glabrata TaxID=6526 RepID=A0A9U8EFE8_BIOGL|nr:putative ferric-chelate reductase 1 homolog isoform X1 [Biomphalaria glabrata]XP_055864221.1 putative ferric-chelate reductase 1 homolog isoform X1 [Biomphalaria glabrata]XP_055864228.1 putative ferric-chelate reductase 1 homolog isoform X1 [Biomphalaria glabrata]XP_055864234.1 putative ferric-chelate reductase 1 homolog isoform X1 [Biomphalaria glabrata]